VAERFVHGRGPAGAAGWLESAVKLIIAVRAGLLVVTLFYVPEQKEPTALIVALCVAAVASFVPLRFWAAVGPRIVRQPAFLAGETVLATVILLLTGVQSPFFYYTLGTALLAGLLYGYVGAAMFSVILFGVYHWAMDVRSDSVDERLPDTFQTLIGSPALYVVIGIAGAAARRLLDAQADSESALAEQEREAAAQRERARLARDMHDSLAKTVHGIGLSALGLAKRIERDPAAAAVDARLLAEDAKRAAQQARDLISGLRAEQEAEQPPTMALRSEAERWSAATGMRVTVMAEDVDSLAPVAARELVQILKEALRNVERHARGASVGVRVRSLGGRVVLSVADDGPGFEVPDDLDALSQGRHYGVTGMRERARVAGGDLMVESAPGEGCVISAWVPMRSPETPVEPAEEPRSVPGYTWQ
jgi:signal transduction histidine kinase